MRLRLQKCFSSTTSVIFVAAPVAVAMSDDSGCSSTSQQPMTQEEVQTAMVGNTAHSEQVGAYAFIDTDGTIRAELVDPDGRKTDSGTWTVDEDGQFCIDWTETGEGKDNCGQLVALGDNTYEWGGHTLTVRDGNTNNL